MPKGVIVKGIGGFYYIGTDDGLYECRARGIFRNNEIAPLPGDKVIISILDEDKKIGSLDEILERNTCLVRPAVANVNQIIVIIAVESPQIDYNLLDKLLITADKKNIKPVICINKIDLDGAEKYYKIVEQYEKIGYEVFPTSSKTKIGYDKLKSILINKVTVFAGQSGVGKSTILNNIVEELVMATGNVSKKINRGKHTTRHAELIELKEGGYIVDTPGFSSFLLENIKYIELENYFPEFSNFVDHCRFQGCSHISEPDCAVKDACDSGIIEKIRYERYISIYNDLKKEENGIWKKKKQGKKRI